MSIAGSVSASDKWRGVAVVAGFALAAMALAKAVFVGATIFYLFTVLFVVGATLIMRKRVVGGSIPLIFASLVWAIAEGLRFPHSGFDPVPDFFVVNLGVPLAFLTLVATIMILRARRQPA